LPIHIVGFSSFSTCLTWRFMRDVSGLLVFCVLLFVVFYRYT
jgi:hypothetical protein